jgi:hypothetical protein
MAEEADLQEAVAYAVSEAMDDSENHSLSYVRIAEAAADGIANYLLDWSDPAFLEDIIPAMHAATKRLASRCNLHVEARIAEVAGIAKAGDNQ